MNTSVKRFISLCLCLALMAGLGVSALAADKPVYTALGDSIPAGYGLSTADPSEYSSRIEGSYPALVADTLGMDLRSEARCGFRSVEIKALLDPEGKDVGDEFTEALIVKLGGLSGMAEFESMRDGVIADVRDADIITVNLGSNDTMTYAIQRLKAFLAKSTTNTETLAEIEDVDVSSMDYLFSGARRLLELARTMGKYSLALAELTDAMNDGYRSFKSNWEYIMGRIFELNSDVQVLAVGMYNPFRDLKLTDYSLLSIGKLADQFVGLMNSYIKYLSDYSDEYAYVDVSDAEAYGFPSLLSGDFAIDMTFILNVHPTPEGHMYISEQVLAEAKALEPEAGGDTKPSPVSASLVNFVKDSRLYKGFSDVLSGKWYDGSVREAVELGIMSGYGDGQFMPENSIKLCEVIKMAAVSHSIYSGDGFVFDESVGGSWYDTYLAYALNENIIAVGEFTDMSAPATRSQMAHIFASAMSEALTAVNSVSFSDIPDVTGDGVYDGDILALYTAGILEGRDGGWFDPDSSITRAECAALISRICIASSRIVK